jgi:hypothetical protein
LAVKVTPHIIAGPHLRATPDGEVWLRVSGDGPATVSLRSTWRIAPRWLGSSRARHVRFGARRIVLQPDTATRTSIRLSREHLALLHRMRTIRATIRVRTETGVVTRMVELHSPAKRARPGGRDSVGTRRQPAAPPARDAWLSAPTRA